ncbi:MAG: TrmH family RNA methyltransferase [Thermomicrobiales bacterium]
MSASGALTRIAVSLAECEAAMPGDDKQATPVVTGSGKLIAAKDRNSLKPEDTVTSQWPRTDRRYHRIASVLRHRQLDLTVVMEDVHDQHNASAVLRSCDGVGVLDVHLVYTHDTPPLKALGATTSASAAKWIRLHPHDSIEACYGELRKKGFLIWATALNEESRGLYSIDLVRPTAFVFGNEMRGVTEAAGELADGTIYIPMQGMVESLNISVACAVTLYEAMRQRLQSGRYEQSTLNELELATLEADWLKR